MKYLKYYEAFYSPVKQIYKGNIGTDFTNDTGANSYPMNSFEVNDEDKAFTEGEKSFSEGKDINENPYIDQQYPNTTLIKKWEDGWNNGLKNKGIKEKMEIDFAGNMLLPNYLSADYEDDINSAYDKGRDAREAGCDLDENPYLSLDMEEDNAIKELYYAWEDGWNS